MVIFFLVLGAGCTIPFYFESPSILYKFGMAKRLLRAGKIFGILAGILLVFQPIFIARFSFIDRIFPQDRRCRFHKHTAIVLTGAAILHPMFVLWAENFSFFPMEIRYWPEFLGIGLLSLVCVMTSISVFRGAVHLRWNKWFLAHRILAPLILILFFIHVLNVSKSFESGLPNHILLLTVFFTTCCFIIKWLFSTAFFKKPFRVISVTPAAKDAWAVNVKPLSGKVFPYIPGQFAYITPVGNRMAREEHPFTIASSCFTTDHLQFVIRSCGEFTDKIEYLKPDDILLIDGPYGQFSHVLVKEKLPVIMIAGGIGITPMLSMLRFMAHSQDPRKVVLIWSNRTRDHIILAEKLSGLTRKMKHLVIHHVITRDSFGQVSCERIDEQSLGLMLYGFDRQAAVFLCGPPAMVAVVKKLLKVLGFSGSRVYTESFLL
ncbi:MAG: ferric reductase-like transmembrane domain-containing protein [Proteobacteria bacterium]|nr:ferric reductase-like transmembrane domain-containing protein [Pseudomonadota bacterium]MBU1583835.1 ferric reductase-like transmembrane domain-containing protein [Pseudomonadota bacterium]MBU2453884.1 ferric reductase-like transmembrane domain-containing protein [Pseudomonadota bacterium]MBU2628624.1 ferric reductase-like transmembrane domain-containing protein [Pseudomonadota bacterium]